MKIKKVLFPLIFGIVMLTASIFVVAIDRQGSNNSGVGINSANLEESADPEYVGDVTIPFAFKKIEYTITCSGCSMAGSASYYIESSEQTRKLTANVPEGYSFDYWEVYGYDGDAKVDSDVLKISADTIGNITVIAHFRANIYKVTLINGIEDGEVGKAGTREYWYEFGQRDPDYYYTDAQCKDKLGENGYTIEKPERTGYVFAGYNSKEDGTGTLYVDDKGECVGNIYKKVADNTTLYAQWTPNSYTIKFNTNFPSGVSGSGATADQKFTYTDNKNLNTCGFSCDDYRFAGWNTKADGSGVGFTSASITTSEIISTLGYENNNEQVIDLYAQWSKSNVAITVHIQDTQGVSREVRTQNVDRSEGRTIQHAINDLGEEVSGGIEFGYAEANGTTIPDNSLLINYEEIDIYFNRVQYSITFDPNGGTWGGSDSKSIRLGYYYQGEYTLTQASRGGYEFKGWKVISGITATNEITDNRIAIETKDIELQAMWEGSINNIQFRNVFGLAEDQQYNTRESNQNFSLPNDDQMIRCGYNFTGWSYVSGPNISILEKVDGQELLVPANAYGTIILKAEWEEILYNITIKDGEGSVSKNKYSISSADQAMELTPTTKKGYSFSGWTVDRASNEVSIDNNSLIIKANTTEDILVTAIWVEGEYTITLVAGTVAEWGTFVTSANMWNYAGADGYTSSNPGNKYLYNLTGNNASLTIKYNAALTNYRAPVPVAAGYNFKGWYTVGHDINQGVQVTDSYGNWKASVEGYTDEYTQWVYDNNLNLFAVFTPKKYIIEYNYADGVGTNPDEYAVNDHQAIADPKRTGYTFAGWDTTITLSKQNKATLLSSREQKYIAETSSAVIYEMFYIANGVNYSGTICNEKINWVKYTANSIETISSNKDIVGSGIYVVNYYPEGNDADTVTVNFTIPSGGFNTATYKLMGNLTLTARWNINSYKLTIDPNGGMWDGKTSTSEIERNYNDHVVVENPERLGYSFAGWSYSDNGGLWDEANAKFTYTGDGTLTATWEAVSPTITILAEPNDSETQSTITYGESVLFTADAQHDLLISYQWHISKDEGFTPSVIKNTAISGAVNSTYTHQPIGAGTYYVKCVATANGLSTTSNEIKLIVAKAQNEFEVDIKEGLIYNTTAQVLLEATDINEVEGDVHYLVYKYENDERGAEIDQIDGLPRATNPGKYIVYFSVNETNNYFELTGYAIVEIGELYTTLTIDPNGGEWYGKTTKHETTKRTGETVNIPDPTRLGYEFTGWAIEGAWDFDEATKTFTFGLTNTTLKAMWNAEIYNIVIDVNGGTQVDNLTYITGETEKSLPKVERGGYKIKEWKFVKSSSPAASIEDGKLIIPNNATGDIDVQVVWEGLNNSITYNFTKGGWKHGFEPSANQSKYTTSEDEITINLPSDENVECLGYNFDGWDYNGTTINELVIGSNVYGDITLTAVWSGSENTITYNLDGGAFVAGYNPTTTGYTTQDSQDCETKSIPTGDDVSRGGYSFTGWSITTDSYPNATIKGSQISIPKGAYGNIALTANWEGRKNNIDYNLNGGKWGDGYTATPTSYKTAEEEQTLNLPTSDNITREGYDFGGWQISSNTIYHHSSIDSKTILKVPANAYVRNGGYLVLTAQWNIQEGTLTIDYGYDGKVDEPIKRNYGTKYVPEQPTREGYNFSYWAHSGAGKYENSEYVFGNGNGTLTAQWSIQSSTLTIDTDGGDLVGDTTITRNYGDSVQINSPTKTGYKFVGWELDGSGTLVNAENISTYTFNVTNDTLTAQWEADPYDLAHVTIADIKDQRYLNRPIQPKLVVTTTDGYELIEGVDYTCSYMDNIVCGNATVVITGMGKFTGSRSATFVIKGFLVVKPQFKEFFKYNATEQQFKTINWKLLLK